MHRSCHKINNRFYHFHFITPMLWFLLICYNNKNYYYYYYVLTYNKYNDGSECGTSVRWTEVRYW